MYDFFSGLGAIITVLASLCFVLFLAYWLLHWLNKRMPSQATGGGIRVLDRLNIGKDKCLLVVKVADKTMLIAVSNNNIEKLADYDSDEPFIRDISQGQSADFKSVLLGAVGKWPSKLKGKEDSDEKP